MLRSPVISSPGCDFEEGLDACGWTHDNTTGLQWRVTCHRDQTSFTGPLHGIGYKPDKSKYSPIKSAIHQRCTSDH